MIYLPILCKKTWIVLRDQNPYNLYFNYLTSTSLSTISTTQQIVP